MTTYQSQSARDAQAGGFGNESYWLYLDEHAQEMRDHYLRRGESEIADKMLTRSLSESLVGNEGE